MIFYNSIMGIPVINSNNDMKLGCVKDILISKSRTIIGLIIEEKGIFTSPKYIPLEDIEKTNKTSVTVKSDLCIKEIGNEDYEYKILTNKNQYKINTEVYNNKIKIGKVCDILLDFRRGIVAGYMISDGIAEDILKGRLIIHNKNLKPKSDRFILTDEKTLNIKKYNYKYSGKE